MYCASVFNRVAAVGFLIVVFGGSIAMADGRDSDDRRGRSSARSSSGGSAWSRRISAGRSSSSDSGNSSRSISSRNLQSMQVPSSGSSSRSIGADSGNNSFSGRVFDGRSSVGRSSDSGPSILRSFGGETTGRSVQGNLSNRGDSDRTRSNFLWSLPGIASRDGSVDRYSGRLRNDLNNSSQFNGSWNDARRSETTTGPSNVNAPTGSDNSNPFSRGFSRSQSQTATSQPRIDGSRTRKADTRASGQSPGNQVRSQDTTTRPTNDKIRDFLQLRRDNAVEQVGGVVDDPSNRRFGRTPGATNFGSNAHDGIGQFNLRDQITDSKKAGDQAWTKRFGGPNGIPGDRLQKGAAATPRGGNGIQHAGNAIIQGDKRAGNDRKLDRALIDRTYQGWRKNALGGEAARPPITATGRAAGRTASAFSLPTKSAITGKVTATARLFHSGMAGGRTTESTSGGGTIGIALPITIIVHSFGGVGVQPRGLQLGSRLVGPNLATGTMVPASTSIVMTE